MNNNKKQIPDKVKEGKRAIQTENDQCLNTSVH